MYKPLGLDHVVLRVRDQARSRRFYEDVLGCTLDRFNERISLMHLRFGEALIDLLPATEAGPVGPDHFCLSIKCDDLKAVAEELRGKAVALEGDVVQRYGAYPTSAYGYYDYDGDHVAAYQQAARLGPPAIDEYLQTRVWGCATFEDHLLRATSRAGLDALDASMREML